MILTYLVVLFLAVCSGQEISFRAPDIIRPCPAMNLNCVRRYIVRNSGCSPEYGPLGDLYVPGQLELQIPHANLTLTWNDPHLRGLGDARLLEFYVNRDTNKVVLELEFRQVSVYTPAATIKYYFKGMEPLYLTDTFRLIYKTFSLTVTVPYDPFNGIRWIEKDVYTYIEDPNTLVYIGSGLVNDDTQVQAAFRELLGSLDNLNLSIKEGSVVTGPYFFDLFFDNLICRF